MVRYFRVKILTNYLGYYNIKLYICINQNKTIMTLEIHQGKIGNVELSGDNGSVQMIWNNIIGVNFNDRKDVTDWYNYTNGQVLEGMFRTKETLILVGDGKEIDKWDRLNRFRRPLIGGVKKLEDVATLKDARVIGLQPEAKALLTKQYSGAVYYTLSKLDEKGSRLMAHFENIIGSRLIAYIMNDSIPVQEEVNLIKLSPVEQALNGCRVEGNFVMLPPEQLDSKTYNEVKKTIEKIGGKWNTSVQGFKFDTDPTDLFNRLLTGEKINLKQDFQFFETPEGLIQEMIKKADIQSTDEVLEPSAGRGAIVKLLKPLAKTVTMCEFMKPNRDYLEQEMGYEVSCSDFLELDTQLKYDKIVANPPFSKNQDITHTLKMYDHLKDGGKMVVITSTAWVRGSQKKQVAFKEFLESVGAVQTEIASGTFKASGTEVSTMMLEISKK